MTWRYIQVKGTSNMSKPNRLADPKHMFIKPWFETPGILASSWVHQVVITSQPELVINHNTIK